MKYTSLTHNNRGHNTQSDFPSVSYWEDYCKEDESIIWSKVYEARSGALVKSYWSEEFEECRGEVNDITF